MNENASTVDRMAGEMTCLFTRTGSTAFGCTMCLNSFRDTFGQNHHSDAFHTSCGASGTGTYQHDDSQGTPKYRYPLHVVRLLQIRWKYAAKLLEKGFAERFLSSHRGGAVEHCRNECGKEESLTSRTTLTRHFEILSSVYR